MAYLPGCFTYHWGECDLNEQRTLHSEEKKSQSKFKQSKMYKPPN